MGTESKTNKISISSMTDSQQEVMQFEKER